MAEIKTRPVTIAGIGSYVPERVVTNQELIDTYNLETTDEWIQKKIGIQTRRYAAPDQQTSDLCVEAAKRAMEMADVGPEDIGGIMLALGIGDVRSPNTACIVQRKLGCFNAWAMDANTACMGFVFSCDIGAKFVGTGSCDAFLAIGGDIGSRTKVSPYDRTVGVIFGDSAGAAVLKPCREGEGFLSFYAKSDGRGADHIGMRAGGSEMPLTPENVKEGKHYIHMDGPKVWENAIFGMDDAIRNAIRLAGLTGDDVDFVVTHQANLRMIEVIMKNAGQPMEKTHTTVQKYGNTSSGTIGTALDEAFRMGKVKPGDNVVLAGIGAGYTWGGTVIRWTCSL